MKSILIILGIACSSFNPRTGYTGKFIDPTGTYILKGEIAKNRITGHSGEIRVKLLTPEKVAMSFYISKGYPGYESGSFVDTLPYADNCVRYTPPADTACTIVFDFNEEEGTSIQQWFTNPHSSCGFAKGVMVSKTFEKRSDNVPIIQDLASRGAL